MRILRAVHIKSHVYPTMLQDTPVGQSEVINVQQFIAAINAAAIKYLPNGRHSLKIKEEYISE